MNNLNKNTWGILTKLRLGHGGLDGQKKWGVIDRNCLLCNKNKINNAYHVLMECDKFGDKRSLLLKEVRLEYLDYIYDGYNLELFDLLFPFQNVIDWDDNKDDYDKMIDKRIRILNSIVNFINDINVMN